MRRSLIALLSFFIAMTALGQQSSLVQIDSLLQGTWKYDSGMNQYNPSVIKIDFKKGDTDIAYFNGKRYRITKKDEIQCRNYKSKIMGYSLYEILSQPMIRIADDVETTVIPNIYVIGEISKTHLFLYWNGECKLLPYSKVNGLTVEEEVGQPADSIK